MNNEATVYQEVERFVYSWQEEIPAVKGCFVRLIAAIRNLDGVTCSFMARPGISYSIRPRHQLQQNRDFFMILDVIDDDPAARWLSVCFFSDLITDPQDRGEVIPGGLAGSDGYCFDFSTDDETMIVYLEQRCLEACESVKAQAKAMG